MSWGTIGSFFTPDTFLCAGDTSLPPLCPARDVLLPPALPTGWDAPKKILVASVQSLLPKFITSRRSTAGTSGRTHRVLEGTKTPGRCPQAPELLVRMRIRVRLWCSPGSAAAPLAHSCTPHLS